MNLQDLGRRAASLLFDAIEGRRSHDVEKVPRRLVVRGSTLSTV